jgi:hypothetical protein
LVAALTDVEIWSLGWNPMRPFGVIGSLIMQCCQNAPKVSFKTSDFKSTGMDYFLRKFKGINSPGLRGKTYYGISSRKIKIDAKHSNPITFQNLSAKSLILTYI